MPTLSLGPAEIHYRDQGKGPVVVLVHSSSSSGGQWRGLVELLEDRFRCLVPDLHGYGRSSAWREGTGASLYGDECAILEALMHQGQGPVHLVGHSYGGMLATLATLKWRDAVKTLTLIEPTLFTFLRDAGEAAAFAEIEAIGRETSAMTAAGEPEAAARLFLDYWVAAGALDAMPERQRAAVVASMPKLRQEWPFMQREDLPVLADLAKIDCPVLVLRSTATTLAASRVVDLILPVLSWAFLAEIDGTGHMAPVTHPQAVNPLIADFLRRHSA